jgi:hypothetical protein
MHVGEDEVLLEDSLRYGERLENADGTVQVHTWKGMVHVFPSNVALLHATKEALDDIGDFLREQLRRPLDGQSRKLLLSLSWLAKPSRYTIMMPTLRVGSVPT